MPGFVKVGELSEFPEGRGRMVLVDGKRVAVFKVGGDVFAMQDACPHMGASLADGRIEGGRVNCFWHGWWFDLSSGRSCPPPGRSWACAQVYEVRVDGQDVLIERPEPRPEPPAEESDDWVPWDDEFLKRPDQEG